MSIKWNWAAEEKKKGDEGFNNAGILTFNSHAINSLVRELFQNSNDAKAQNENKVIINIEYLSIKKEEIPEIQSYQDILELVKESHPDRSKFFDKANKILKREEIPFLVYSDYNTNGLTGLEEETNSSFVACVLSEGKSVKESKTSGGSYGIGKNAIYGVSSLRTVFYSSIDTNNNPIFQGVAKLASYKKDGKNHEGRIYLGDGKDRLSIRDLNSIPNVFKRNGPGLTQFVMGVELDNSWHIEFTKAILRNYWMLLIEDGLEVKLIHNHTTLVEINHTNTPQLLEQMFKNDMEDTRIEPYGNPFLFFQAFKEGKKIEMDIPIIKNCIFYYKESEQGENNIAYLRNGMVINSRIEKRLVGANVTGVFKCQNEEGNEILRKMEPPKHDSFEPQMLEENHENLTKQNGEDILKEIKSRIREVIKSLIEKFKQEIETPHFLAELFEDLQKHISSANKGERKNETIATETLYRIAAEDELSVSLLSDRENEYASTKTGNALGDGSGSVLGSGPVAKKSKIKGGGGTKGGSSKGGTTPKYPITSRVFHYESKNNRNVYKAIIHSEENLGTIELDLSQHADSGEDIAFQLHHVESLNGAQINFNEIKDSEGIVSQYKVVIDISEGKNSFLLDISDNQKSAFVINR